LLGQLLRVSERLHRTNQETGQIKNDRRRNTRDEGCEKVRFRRPFLRYSILVADGELFV
jgi:hypothetical protein